MIIKLIYRFNAFIVGHIGKADISIWQDRGHFYLALTAYRGCSLW